MVTAMAGVLLIGMGATGLGTVVRYIPRPVIIGFTNGVALLIATTQIKDFLGLRFEGNPSGFFARMQALGHHLHTMHGPTAPTAIASLAVVVLWPRLARRVPGTNVAVVAATAAVAVFCLQIEPLVRGTAGSRRACRPSRSRSSAPTTSCRTSKRALARARDVAEDFEGVGDEMARDFQRQTV